MKRDLKLALYILSILTISMFTLGMITSAYVHYGYHDCHVEKMVLVRQYLAPEPDCSMCLHIVVKNDTTTETFYFAYEGLQNWTPGDTLAIEVCKVGGQERVRRVVLVERGWEGLINVTGTG